GRCSEPRRVRARYFGRSRAAEPVLAGPPTAGYRLRKLLRRNWGKVATGAAFALLLLAAVAMSTWQAVRAAEAEQNALAESSNALQAAALERKAREAEIALRKDALRLVQEKESLAQEKERLLVA